MQISLIPLRYLFILRSGGGAASAAWLPDPLRAVARRRQPADHPLRRRLRRAQDERVQTGEHRTSN